MSYDLYFWRYLDETVSRQDDREVCNSLLEGGAPEGLASLAVEDVTSAIADVMGQAGWTNDGIFWEREGVITEIYIEKSHVQASLRGKWTSDDANRLIDVMNRFRCPLFDAQTGERFQV